MRSKRPVDKNLMLPWRRTLPHAAAILLLLLSPHGAEAAEFAFRVHEFETELQVGYAVVVCDVDADGKNDIVVADTQRVLLYQAPDWERSTLVEGVTRPDNVCLAPYDIDGDGKIDLALGADWRPFDTQSGGTIQWLSRGESPRTPWSVHPIGEEPTVHRMRWADVNGDGRHELLVVPLMGRGTTRPLFNEQPLRILAFHIPDDPVGKPWPAEVLNEELHVAHNFWPVDLDSDGQTEILVVSFEGLSLLARTAEGSWRRTLIGEGNQQTTPERGASEVKAGRLAGGGRYIATIEPWHGFQVVVYRPPTESQQTLWTRQVLDEDLKWGHAVWCANLDADEDEELIIGVRDDKDPHARRGLRIYDPSSTSGEWRRHLIDEGSVAIEDLAAADLDGDGRTDIVAVGRQTHNARIYFNEIP